MKKVYNLGARSGLELFDTMIVFMNNFKKSVNFEATKYTQQKKLRKSQKTMQLKNTKAYNYSIFIYLFRYMSSVEKNV